MAGVVFGRQDIPRPARPGVTNKGIVSLCFAAEGTHLNKDEATKPILGRGNQQKAWCPSYREWMVARGSGYFCAESLERGGQRPECKLKVNRSLSSSALEKKGLKGMKIWHQQPTTANSKQEAKEAIGGTKAGMVKRRAIL